MSMTCYFFGVCLCGFKDGVLPGVSLLSRRRWSGLFVDGAMGFGPGLIDICAFLGVGRQCLGGAA